MYKVEHISVLGYSQATPSDPLYKRVRQVTKHLATAGYTIVNGGGPGVMRAASEGAKEGGGRTIGVTFYPKDATNYEGRDPKNPLDMEIKTANYLERTLKLLEIGEVYLIFNGGTGTISEFGMAWGLSRIYFGHNKPILLFGHFWEEVLAALARYMKLREEEKTVYQIVENVTEITLAIEKFEKRMSEGGHLHPGLEDSGHTYFI